MSVAPHPSAAVVPASRFRAVVFDMDGVVTDTAAVHAAAWKRMFDAFLVARGDPDPFDERDYRQFVDGKHRDDGVAAFLASRGIALPRGDRADPPDADTVWGLANRKNRDFVATLAAHGARAFPTSVALVRTLQEHGIGTAVISASRNCQAVLDAAGIGGLFPVRVDGREAERLGLPGKPDPAVFVEAARRLGAAPAMAVVVEDAVAGVEAGRRGGFGLVVGVDRIGDPGSLTRAGADVVVADLGDVLVTE